MNSNSGSSTFEPVGMGDYQKEVFLKSPLKKIFFDVNGIILWANEAYAKAFAKTRSEIEGTSFLEYLVEKDREPFLAELQKIQADPSQSEFFLTVSLKGTRTESSNDALSELTAVAIRYNNGQVRYFNGWVRNLTNKRTTPDSRITSANMGSSGAFSRALVMVVNEHGIMTSFEGYMSEYYIPDPVGKHYKEIYHNKPQNQAWIERALAGETFQVEVEYEGLWYHIWYMPVKDSNGIIKGATWTAWPSTYFKIKEFKLTQKLEKEKEDLLSMASHEIKNPLSILSLQLEWLNRCFIKENSTAEVQKKAVDIIELGLHQVSRIARLTERILNSTARSKNRSTINASQFDLVALVKNTIEGFCALYPDHLDSFKIQAPETIQVGWDYSCIEEILDNLISNAIKYGKAPFVIEIKKSANQIHLLVTDHGNGISAKHQTRIFNQYDRTGSPNEIKGLGMGLWIVKSIAEAHLGSVSVQSEEGKGATFIVSLPIDPFKSLQASDPRESASESELRSELE